MSGMDVSAVVDVLGSLAAPVAAIGVVVVNAKLDKLVGRVDELGRTVTTHVNTSGLHR